ncbi:hypothetical protein BJX96DRAFT_170736 [Aspergillus floccosus]
MATYRTDASPERSTGRTHRRAQSEPSSPGISDRYDIMADLPRGYQLQSFSSCSTPKQLQNAVRAIYEQLEHDAWQGNQWLVIRGMSQAAIQRLSNSPDCLAGIPFRFMWVGTTGLIKVVPSVEHGFTTSELRSYIEAQRLQMGMPRLDMVWGATVTTPGTLTTHGKQADDCVYPRNREPVGGQFRGWPTLVVETGVSESLAKLRRDATWWFQNSSGDTKIVLVISIKRATKQITIEKWQLAPSNLPRPVTRQAINQLRQQPNQMPPLGQQKADNQFALSIQEIAHNTYIDHWRASCDSLPGSG